MAWTKPRWSNSCNAHAELSGARKASCGRKAGHGGKWHRDGEVRWRVAKPEPEIPAEPHLHNLRLHLNHNLRAMPFATMTVPLPCSVGGQGRAFSREYLIDGTLISITGEVT